MASFNRSRRKFHVRIYEDFRNFIEAGFVDTLSQLCRAHTVSGIIIGVRSRKIEPRVDQQDFTHFQWRSFDCTIIRQAPATPLALHLMRRNNRFALCVSIAVLIVSIAVSINRGANQKSVAKKNESLASPSASTNSTQTIQKEGPSITTRATAEVTLRDASPSDRNGIFLIAIHKAGYFCDYVDSTYESVDGVWLAECIDRRDYKIVVRDSQTLHVEPIVHRIDETF